MKISKVLFTAAILVFAISLFSCDDGGGGLSLLGEKKVSVLKDFEGTLVAENEAIDLLMRDVFKDSSSWITNTPTSDFMKMLKNANEEVYNAALLEKYKVSSKSTYFSNENYKGNLSPSVSVSIDDKEKLKTKANVTAASIKGSSKSSKISSASEATSYTTGYTNSINKTFAITDGFYTNGGYKVAGIITIEANESSKTTVKAVSASDSKTESSKSKLTKISAALTISKTTTGKGGKYIISYSFESSGNSRASKGADSFIYSDIKVYDNANELKYTFNSNKYDVSDIDGIADFFID